MKNEDENTVTAEVIPEYIKKTLQFSGASVLQINVKYPNIKIMPSEPYKKAEKRINDFYDSTAKNFIRFCERNLFKNAAAEYMEHKIAGDDGFKPFGAVMTFETPYNKRDFLCVYLDINIYAGKGRGNAKRKAHIWKMDGELVSPERFIKFIRPVKKKICEYICEIMNRQIERGEEYYIKHDMPAVYKYLNMRNFYLSEGGYSFFFPQNTVAPFENGIVSFQVPEKIISGG